MAVAMATAMALGAYVFEAFGLPVIVYTKYELVSLLLVHFLGKRSDKVGIGDDVVLVIEVVVVVQ